MFFVDCGCEICDYSVLGLFRGYAYPVQCSESPFESLEFGSSTSKHKKCSYLFHHEDQKQFLQNLLLGVRVCLCLFECSYDFSCLFHWANIPRECSASAPASPAAPARPSPRSGCTTSRSTLDAQSKKIPF